MNQRFFTLFSAPGLVPIKPGSVSIKLSIAVNLLEPLIHDKDLSIYRKLNLGNSPSSRKTETG
jgi:hypothetical protein